MIDVFAWALIQFLWQGVLLGALAWLVLRAVPERLAQLRYIVLCALLAAMAMCPVATVLTYRSTPAAVPVSAAAWTEWAVAFWAAGLCVMSVRALGGWTLAWRRQHRERQPLPDALASAVRRLGERMKVRRTVRWFVSAHVLVPRVFGWLKPVVLVPASALTAMPPEQIEALLAHELAHVRRHDFLVNVGQVLIETVLFYHPAVWWLSARIREEREACCDQMAAAACGDAKFYASALLTLEETRERYAMAASGTGLERRVRRLLGAGDAARSSWTAIAVSVLVLAAAAWAMAPGAQRQNEPLREMHARWLQQEVRYIIAPEERTKFLALRSGEEREHFIAQFWARRPGMKTEHYRRLSYARERFGSVISPRSHAYVVFGPPDENESHPGDPVPYEIWRWRNGRTITFGGPDYLPDGSWPAQ